jgi:hypothetical protein
MKFVSYLDGFSAIIIFLLIVSRSNAGEFAKSNNSWTNKSTNAYKDCYKNLENGHKDIDYLFQMATLATNANTWKDAIQVYAKHVDAHIECLYDVNKKTLGLDPKTVSCHKYLEKAGMTGEKFYKSECKCNMIDHSLQLLSILSYVLDVSDSLKDIFIMYLDELTNQMPADRLSYKLNNKADTLEMFCRRFTIFNELTWQFNSSQRCPVLDFDNADQWEKLTKTCRIENKIENLTTLSLSEFELYLKCLAVSLIPASQKCAFVLRRHAMFWLFVRSAWQFDYSQYYADRNNYNTLITTLLNLDYMVRGMNRSTVWLGNGLVKSYRGRQIRRLALTCFNTKDDYFGEEVSDSNKANTEIRQTTIEVYLCEKLLVAPSNQKNTLP